MARATYSSGHLATYAIIFGAGTILLWKKGAWGLLLGPLGIGFHEGLWNIAYLFVVWNQKPPSVIWAWAFCGVLACYVMLKFNRNGMIIMLPWLLYLTAWVAIGFPMTLDYRFGGMTPYYYSAFANIIEIGSWLIFCPSFLLYCSGVQTRKPITPHAVYDDMPKSRSR